MKQESEPQLPRRVALQGILYGHEVLQRLGHLAARDRQVPRVEEVVHPAWPVVVRL